MKLILVEMPASVVGTQVLGVFSDFEKAEDAVARAAAFMSKKEIDDLISPPRPVWATEEYLDKIRERYYRPASFYDVEIDKEYIDRFVYE